MKTRLTFAAISVVFAISCGLFQPEQASPKPVDVDSQAETSESGPSISNARTQAPSLELEVKKAAFIAIGCAITTDGETRCWDNVDHPYKVEALPPLAGVECAARSCLGYTGNGELYAWNKGSPAKLLDGIRGVTDIAMTSDFTCAVAAGTPRCWGKVPGRNTGLSDTPITDDPLFPGRDWAMVDASDSFACFFVNQGVGMCVGFLPGMTTNSRAYGFYAPSVRDVTDLRFSGSVYCTRGVTGEVVCSDDDSMDPDSDPFPKGFFSNSIDFDVDDLFGCKINADYSVECIKDGTVTLVGKLRADGVSIRTSGLTAMILLSDGSISLLNAHSEYKITYIKGFGPE